MFNYKCKTDPHSVCTSDVGLGFDWHELPRSHNSLREAWSKHLHPRSALETPASISTLGHIPPYSVK